ncbi:uncharacterized protein Alh isoform X6 [Epargyreus clarus]|uniref:uncharacterized protein Alh isoform X6 n=1 Tax=Epargyreus clarus TaxID=520877 RepID=UPI003C2D9C08
MKEMVGGCCVCSDERGWPDNPLVYCDGNGCTVAVHQACYGIIAVPTGPWYCRKCESPENKGKVRCELCPSKSGALKRADTGGWAHVVCALYIPEVRFGNVTSMEPIVLRLIPPERFNKTCYICQDMNKPHRASAGACMQCNKTGCKQQFHVTCAQSLGLLCEEAGNYLDNVKYCGYCQYHYSKLVSRLKKGGNVKTIPPYKPVSHDSQSSDSSCDKDGETSPVASGSGTPTHAGKSKGPGRKTSHSSSGKAGNQSNSAKTPTNSGQASGSCKEMLEPLVTRKHKSDKTHWRKNKKKQSPARRGSSTGDGGSSKASTPAPSPQHSMEPVAGPSGKCSGGSTPSTSKAPQPMTSPTAKAVEPVGVISSIATATSAAVSAMAAAPASTVEAASSATVATITAAPASSLETVTSETASTITAAPASYLESVMSAAVSAIMAAPASFQETVTSETVSTITALPASSMETVTSPNVSTIVAAPASSQETVTSDTVTTITAAPVSPQDTYMSAILTTIMPSPASSVETATSETVSTITAAPVSFMAAPTWATVSTITAAPASTATSTSVVQAPPKPATYESVITNTDMMETKQTKKRKAVSASNTPTAPVDYATLPPAIIQTETSLPQQVNTNNPWEAPSTHQAGDIQMEVVDKIIKKAKTDGTESSPAPAHFSSVSPAPPPPPPPPAHSPASQPSPRHLPSPMAGPSGINTITHIRSPSHAQVFSVLQKTYDYVSGKGERELPPSLLVSVPLPSTSHGINLTAHSQVPAAVDMATSGPSPHIFHQPPKQAAMEPSMQGHSSQHVPARSAWGGLNVSYEMQQDLSKPGVSGVAGPSKDPNVNTMGVGSIPMQPTTIRTKKRQAMATSVVSMAQPPPSAIQSAAAVQNLATMRRAMPPQTPAPMYQETIKDSPPSSPISFFTGAERSLKPKMESSRMGTSCTAPHMLGNELNPESGAAARLQEQLSAELAAHAAGGVGLDPLIPPPLINKAAPRSHWPEFPMDLRRGATGRPSTGAQSLDQLLERQWEQGSQFLMEQAQHFDSEYQIASLLSCLHQLRTENVRLEEHVGSLLQRRDHLLAVNARLAIPLTTVSAGPPEPSRCPREPPPPRAPQPPVRAETITSERSHQPHQLLMREVQKPS